MNRNEKTAAIASIHGRLREASLAVMTEYRGLTVAQMNRLRRELNQVGAVYQVTKNTLTRRALKDTSFEKLAELLQGPTGMVTTARDPVVVAKVLVRFAEQHDKLKITGGVLEGAVLQPATVGDLARLPGREVLIAQLLGLIQAPATQLLRTIQEPAAQVARLLAALERAKAAEGGATQAADAAEVGSGTQESIPTEGGAAS